MSGPSDNLSPLRQCVIADEIGRESAFVDAANREKLTINTVAARASLARVVREGFDTHLILDDDKIELPHLIVFPGLTGDDLALVGLRRSLKTHAQLFCIAYPDGRSMMRYRKSFPGIVDATLDQIRSHLHGKTGAVHFLGYSFGGFVAWEAARNLEDSGIRVTSLALIDPIKNVGGPLLRPSLGGGARSLARWLASLACYKLPIPCLLPIHWLACTLAPVPRIRLLRFLEKHLRTRAFYEHALAPHACAATLYVSDAGPDRCTEFWKALCQNIAVLKIGGDHHSIMERPYRQSLKKFIARSLLNHESVEVSLGSLARVGSGGSPKPDSSRGYT